MAPLLQGAEQHSLTSTSQKSPVKPGGQLRKHIMPLKPRGCLTELSHPSRPSDTLYLSELLVFTIYQKKKVPQLFFFPLSPPSSFRSYLYISKYVLKNNKTKADYLF